MEQTPKNEGVPVVFTVDETSKFLSCKPRMIYNLVMDKALPAFRVGNQLRIKKEDIIAYMEKHSTLVELTEAEKHHE